MKTKKGINNRKFKLRKNASLSSMAADQMLQNVFTVVGTTSNTVPLEVIEDYANYKKERFIVKRTILSIAIILLLLSPLLFVKGTYTITEKQVESSPVYEIKVTGIFPVQVSATQNGLHLPVYNTGIRAFTIEPTKNGVMDVYITFYNQQEIHDSIKVTHADTTPPAFIGSQISNRLVYLYISDEETGVDYDSIYAKDAGNETILPISYDSEAGFVVFESPDSTVNVHIPDMVGNELLLILTPNN